MELRTAELGPGACRADSASPRRPAHDRRQVRGSRARSGKPGDAPDVAPAHVGGRRSQADLHTSVENACKALGRPRVDRGGASGE